jgi:transposase, IS5 family
MLQATLASVSLDTHSKQTRRAKFLADMDQVVPWRELRALIAPFYPKAGHGRPPIGLERMLRLQHWFNLSDPAAEEAIYGSFAMRRFVGIDLGREPAPDETTILNFRHLLEQHQLGQALFERINQHLASRGLKVAGGTIVDATIAAAPSSTKNEAKARDPEMHQTRKGQQWYFGMKLHIGVDSKTKLIHAMKTTAANVHFAKVLGELLHGDQTRVYGDQPYRGQTEIIRAHAPNANDFTNQRCRYRGFVDEVERSKTVRSPGYAPRSSIRSG